MHSERHEEFLAAAALGMPIDPAEEAERQSWLDERCAECEALLPELRFAAAALGASVPARIPRPALKAAILSSLGPARTAPTRSSALAAWAFAAAAALLFVVVALDDARLRRQREELRARTTDLAERVEAAQSEIARRDLRARVMESEDVRMLFLGGHGPQPDARGKVFWSEQAKRGILVAKLAPLPADRQYQLWVFVGGKPVDAGVFDADPTGRALFESKDLAAIRTAENFAVTVEPRGGVPQPTGPIVLLGSPS
jgi:Anti-sigma-K factor rskA, C-terminal